MVLHSEWILDNRNRFYRAIALPAAPIVRERMGETSSPSSARQSFSEWPKSITCRRHTSRPPWHSACNTCSSCRHGRDQSQYK
jgi:hypothetical protein